MNSKNICALSEVQVSRSSQFGMTENNFLFQVVQEHKALALLARMSKVAGKSSDHRKCAQKYYLKAQTQLAAFYCKSRQPDLAMGIIKVGFIFHFP